MLASTGLSQAFCSPPDEVRAGLSPHRMQEVPTATRRTGVSPPFRCTCMLDVAVLASLASWFAETADCTLTLQRLHVQECVHLSETADCTLTLQRFQAQECVHVSPQGRTSFLIGLEAVCSFLPRPSTPVVYGLVPHGQAAASCTFHRAKCVICAASWVRASLASKRTSR